MRGGTSKGVFFRLQDLPESCQVAGEARNNLFMRVIGSPDPYGKHIDGMGGATSSTSKCVILSKSQPAAITMLIIYTAKYLSTVPLLIGVVTVAIYQPPQVHLLFMQV
jgi:2-methylaconitate cis-trans-isomerase PrpF